MCKQLLEELDKDSHDPEIQTFYKLYARKLALVSSTFFYLFLKYILTK